MNRVISCENAVKLASEYFGKNLTYKVEQHRVGASDAFFPFPDGPQVLAEAGMTAIVYPLGSVKDQETIDIWNRYDIAACCTRPEPGTKAIERAFSGHR